MIKYTRLFIIFLLAFIVLQANAQSTATTSSPYSRYGLGSIDDQALPQNIGMGGIATAVNTVGGYNTINIINPASYGKITYTTIDAGFYSNSVTLKNDNASEKNSNSRFSHVVFALPVTKRSAVSFGLLPYSEVGYSYKQTSIRNNGPAGSADTTTNYIYSGDGGLSKAYIGYGTGIGRHLLIGANISYIFGNLKQDQSTEIPDLYGTLDSRTEQSNQIGGVNFDYGIQYTIDFSETKHLILGYSASANTKLNVQNTLIVSQYTYDGSGNQNVAADSLVNTQSPKAKIQLPQINHFGISYQKEGSFLIGADYTITTKWPDISNAAGTDVRFQDSKRFNLGGEFTPNSNALNNYLALLNYRVGMIYENTSLNINNVNIKRYAATFGLGLPIPHDRASSAFYKVNFSAEIGKQGTTSNGLVQENYANFHLSFTLNDKWFQRYRYE